jgi:hypothetical protein
MNPVSGSQLVSTKLRNTRIKKRKREKRSVPPHSKTAQSMARKEGAKSRSLRK